MLDKTVYQDYVSKCHELAVEYLGLANKRRNGNKKTSLDLSAVLLGNSAKLIKRGDSADLDHPWGIEAFLKFHARRKGMGIMDRSFELTFCPKRDFREAPLDMQGFISWLVILDPGAPEKTGRLCIVYDSEKLVEGITGLTEGQLLASGKKQKGIINLLRQKMCGGTYSRTGADCDGYLSRLVRMTKAKACLHEGAHIAIHLPSLVAKWNQAEIEEGQHPKSTDRQENEAWVFAILLWSIIVGESAESSRVATGKDNAWKIA